MCHVLQTRVVHQQRQRLHFLPAVKRVVEQQSLWIGPNKSSMSSCGGLLFTYLLRGTTQGLLKIILREILELVGISSKKGNKKASG